MYVIYAFEWLGTTFKSIILELYNLRLPITADTDISLFGVLMGTTITSFAVRQLGKFISNKERA